MIIYIFFYLFISHDYCYSMLLNLYAMTQHKIYLTFLLKNKNKNRGKFFFLNIKIKLK